MSVMSANSRLGVMTICLQERHPRFSKHSHLIVRILWSSHRSAQLAQMCSFAEKTPATAADESYLMLKRNPELQWLPYRGVLQDIAPSHRHYHPRTYTHHIQDMLIFFVWLWTFWAILREDRPEESRPLDSIVWGWRLQPQSLSLNLLSRSSASSLGYTSHALFFFFYWPFRRSIWFRHLSHTPDATRIVCCDWSCKMLMFVAHDEAESPLTTVRYESCSGFFGIFADWCQSHKQSYQWVLIDLEETLPMEWYYHHVPRQRGVKASQNASSSQ